MKSVANNTLSICSVSLPKSPSLIKYINALTSKFKSYYSPEKNDSGMFSYIVKEYGLNGIESKKELPLVEEISDLAINTEEGAVDFFRNVWDTSMFELQERLYALYLDSANRVLGYRLISTGNTSIKNADPSTILLYAEELSAKKVILAHNHPSGVNKPSTSDIEYTTVVFEACEEDNRELVSHFIITKGAHYSIALSKR